MLNYKIFKWNYFLGITGQAFRFAAQSHPICLLRLNFGGSRRRPTIACIAMSFRYPTELGIFFYLAAMRNRMRVTSNIGQIT